MVVPPRRSRLHVSQPCDRSKGNERLLAPGGTFEAQRPGIPWGARARSLETRPVIYRETLGDDQVKDETAMARTGVEPNPTVGSAQPVGFAVRKGSC